MTPLESTALSSLAALSPAIRESLLLCVFDNSPVEASPAEVRRAAADEYVWSPRNVGLAPHYQAALGRAEQEGAGWLLLLDQDTEATCSYVAEVLASVAAGQQPHPDAAVLVPRLVAGGRHVSPLRPVRVRTRAVRVTGFHPASEGCQFLNSGAVLRVDELRAAGGFPQRYPLDYLDHALAAGLRRRGTGIWVLEARLLHDLSVLDRVNVPVDRIKSVARAEESFVLEYGSLLDRVLLVLRRALLVVAIVAGRRTTPAFDEDVASLGRSVRALVAVRRRAPGVVPSLPT